MKKKKIRPTRFGSCTDPYRNRLRDRERERERGHEGMKKKTRARPRLHDNERPRAFIVTSDRTYNDFGTRERIRRVGFTERNDGRIEKTVGHRFRRYYCCVAPAG